PPSASTPEPNTDASPTRRSSDLIRRRVILSRDIEGMQNLRAGKAGTMRHPEVVPVMLVSGDVTPARTGPAAKGDYRKAVAVQGQDRKSTRLNSSHDQSSYAVFCL